MKNIHLKMYTSLRDTIGDDWDAISDIDVFTYLFDGLSGQEFDIACALKVIDTSLLPWSDPMVFENVVDAINSNPVDTDSVTQPDMDDIMYAVYIMSSIRPGIPFSDDIGKYVAARAMVEGLLYVPQPVQWANDYLRIPDQYLPISKKISSYSPEDLMLYQPSADDDEMLATQLSKLSDIVNVYAGKVNTVM